MKLPLSSNASVLQKIQNNCNVNEEKHIRPIFDGCVFLNFYALTNARKRKVTTSARVQVAFGEKVVELVPFVMPRPVAQMTALR